jgi:DNA-binding transcriptional LysR family regulator
MVRFIAAAGDLGYTQSAVSQQLRALERIVGRPLFHRHPGGRRPVQLTETGQLLLSHATDLLARVQATRADLDALDAGEQGRLTLARIQSIGARILPAVLAAYRAARPQVEVEIREMPTVAPLLAAVETGAVDVGFTALPIPEGPFEVRPLISDPYVLVASVHDPARQLSDLHGRRMIGVRGCRHDRLIEERLLAEGTVPASVDRFDDNGMIQELVAAGAGVAVVPELTINPGDPRIAVLPVPELPSRRLVAVLHAERRLGPAVSELVRTAVAVCSEQAGGPSPRAHPGLELASGSS